MSIYEYHKANWYGYDDDTFLRNMIIGKTLNVCSGKSLVGDVRIDIDNTSNRTMSGDLFNLGVPKLSFDTVICDPPFSYYNRFRWIIDLSNIAKKRLILSSNQLQIHLKKSVWHHSLYYDYNHRTKTGKRRLWMRLWWIFDRLNHRVCEDIEA